MDCKCDDMYKNIDEKTGNNVCYNCNKINNNLNFISSLNFENQVVRGRFGNVNGEYTGIRNLRQFGNRVNELRLEKGKKILDLLGNQLELPFEIIEESQRLFKLIHSKNWVQGRNTSIVIGACIYIVCRKNKTPHLLIDFADCLQINIYKLGSIFLKLVRFLHFEIPLIDPSLYIYRFCSKLNFGEMEQEVSLTALRFLQRMKRDWMSHGRRPTGLVGAAILISARYHGFKRTTNQLVQVVKVCDETIRKRLNEFKNTNVAKLTREEFKNIDINYEKLGEKNPPSFKKVIKALEELKKYNIKQEEEENKINEIEKIEKLEENVKDNLSDIDDDEINEYIMTKKETEIKKKLWEIENKDWIEEQKVKENKKILQTREGRRKKTQFKIVNAPDVITSILNYSKIKNKLNTNNITELFKIEDDN